MAVAAAAYTAVKRALSALPGVDTDQVDNAINRDVIESAVDRRGVEAVRDTDVLRAAIDQDAVDAAVDFDEFRDSVADSISSDDYQSR